MYRWVEHTGELELEIVAADEAGVFDEATAAFRELVEHEPAAPPAAIEVELAAADRASLLAEWLSELVFRAETERFVPVRVAALDLTENAIRATVHGRTGDPPHLVKAVTYHRLEFEARDGNWEAHVVFDV